MAKFHLTRRAVDDLTEIWEYTLETWSEHQADIYYRQLIETCQELASHPEMGRYYDDITPPAWRVPFNDSCDFLQNDCDESDRNHPDPASSDGFEIEVLSHPSLRAE